MKSDLELQRDVLRELTCAGGVRVTDIGVGVRRGIIVLTGDVRCYAEKLAAERAAHAVAGVLDVANDVRVHIPAELVRTDTEIAYCVRCALETAVGAGAGRIKSAVSNGWVTLAGDVEESSVAVAAERAVRTARGVAGVLNRITVRGERRETGQAAA
jgi:hyperosmotically inducible protein